jgi:hypothetical protein
VKTSVPHLAQCCAVWRSTSRVPGAVNENKRLFAVSIIMTAGLLVAARMEIIEAFQAIVPATTGNAARVRISSFFTPSSVSLEGIPGQLQSNVIRQLWCRFLALNLRML